MSCGYYAPLSPFTGPDAGEVGDNRAAQIEAARKTAIGLTEDGETVYQLDEDVQYWAVEAKDNQYGFFVGTVRNEYCIPKGTLLVQKKNGKWSSLRYPTRWVDFATSTEWRAGDRSGPLSVHQKTRTFPNHPEWVDETRIGIKRREFEAAFAARWVIENLELPTDDAQYWFDRLCRAQYAALRGYEIEDYGAFVSDALRQYAQGETDAARRAREEEAWRRENSPFAVLAKLKVRPR